MIEPLAYPTTADGWLAFAGTRSDERLERVAALAAELKDGSDRPLLAALRVWNDLQIALGGVLSEAEILAEVHPDPEVRAAAESRHTAAEAIAAALRADAELAAVFADQDDAELDDDAARVRDHLLRDFRRGGADRDAETRAAVQELAERDAALSLAFARNIREGRREIRVPADRLAGLPEDFLAEHPAGDDGLVALSTDATDVMPVLNYARDRGVRAELARARADLAWPENDAVLAELLDVRRRRAALLGYGNWSDYETEDRMARSSARVAQFLDEVDEASLAASAAEYETLLAGLRQDVPDADAVASSDQAFLLTLLHAERFAVDPMRVRSYLSFERVLGGLLAVTGRLFDIEYWPAEVPTWHEDVRSYDVVRGSVRLGRIHLDLHPRDGKYNHAACFPIATGIRGRVLPEAALVCNFPRGRMEHRQVQTFFHEFGHLVHEILGGDQEWAGLSGIATEWDFVEAPSQMLEEWVWDAEVLRTFARDDEGEPIPTELVERMREADAFGRALLVRTQLGHARVSFHLHVDGAEDLAATTDHWYAATSPVRRPEGTHSYAGFGHLTGYGSCYYTYQWSLVIARDLLSGFSDGLMDPAAAARYRREILERGGSADAADLVAAFLGRPFTVDAYRSWLGSPAT
ncbi:Zn-dependent oligopeptidase [Streptomyces sp. MS2A]|nr:Zn-dependent oligopeptidase [Streptomyces sp. MS2A]